MKHAFLYRLKIYLRLGFVVWTLLPLGLLAEPSLSKGSLYDNLIYSMPSSSDGRAGGDSGATPELIRGRQIIKPSATMLSGTAENIDHHMEMAHVAMLQGRNLEAGWHYYYVTQRRPDMMLAKEGLALSMAKTGNVPTAHKMFRSLYELKPNEFRYRIQLAAAEFQLGEYEKALRRLELPRGVPESYDSLYLRGLSYYAAGKVREAVESLQQAHDLELERPDPIKAMAEIFASRKMKEPVETLLSKLKRLYAPEEYEAFRSQKAFSFLDPP